MDGVVSQDLQGWDWVAASPDRNTGIIDQVSISVAPCGVAVRDGSVEVLDLISSHPPTRGGGGGTGNVSIRVRVSLQSIALDHSIEGNVTFSLLSCSITVPVKIAAGVRDWVELISPPCNLFDAPLWWPHTLGSPTLLPATALFISKTTTPTNTTTSTCSTGISWKAGLRLVASSVDQALGGRVFSVNGVRVFLTGGNYIATDALSRAPYRTPQRYAAEVRMHMEMGMNTLRLWGGHGGHGDGLATAADELGVFLLSEFWMSGDNNGRWAGNFSFPLPPYHTLYAAAVKDTVRKLRGHPSLLLWCAGNELFPFNASPPQDILAEMRAGLSALDPGTPFIQSSMGGDERANFSGFDPFLALAPWDGPYGSLDPRTFSRRNSGKVTNGSNIAFQPEIGSGAHPVWESLSRFLSPGPREALPGRRGLGGVHPAWVWHSYENFGDDTGNDQLYLFAPHSSTPSFNSSLEYSLAAQLSQYTQYKALFEGYLEHQFEFYSGVLMWKSAGPWPGLRGALFDWYLAQSGGYWGVRSALEGGGAGLHVQLSRRPDFPSSSPRISLVNLGLLGFEDPLEVSATPYDLYTGKACSPPLKVGVSFIPSGTTLPLQNSTLTWPQHVPEFLTTLLWRLTVFLPNNTSGPPSPYVSQNDYLLSTLESNATLAPLNYSTLTELRKNGKLLRLTLSLVDVRVSTPVGLTIGVSVALDPGQSLTGIGVGIVCTLRDPTRAVVAATGFVDDRVLPLFPDAGYFNLLPGEARVVLLNTPITSLSPSTTVECGGFNVFPAVIPALSSLARSTHTHAARGARTHAQ